MKISIVTISYNQSVFIRQCIDSILSQCYYDLEYIVVDPGSQDDSRTIISSYPEIRCIFEPDNGPADGLRKGLSLASGDVLGFINADDYMLEGSLFAIEAIFTDSTYSFVTGGGYVFNGLYLQPFNPSRLTFKSLIYRSALIFQQSTFFAREAYLQSGGINPSNDTCWDYELYLDILAAGYSHYRIRDKLAVFRIHKNSITGSNRLATIYSSDLQRIFFQYMGHTYNYLDFSITLFRKAFAKLSLFLSEIKRFLFLSQDI